MFLPQEFDMRMCAIFADAPLARFENALNRPHVGRGESTNRGPLGPLRESFDCHVWLGHC